MTVEEVKVEKGECGEEEDVAVEDVVTRTDGVENTSDDALEVQMEVGSTLTTQTGPPAIAALKTDAKGTHNATAISTSRISPLSQTTQALQNNTAEHTHEQYLFCAPHVVLGGQSQFTPYRVGVVPVKPSWKKMMKKRKKSDVIATRGLNALTL